MPSPAHSSHRHQNKRLLQKAEQKTKILKLSSYPIYCLHIHFHIAKHPTQATLLQVLQTPSRPPSEYTRIFPRTIATPKCNPEPNIVLTSFQIIQILSLSELQPSQSTIYNHTPQSRLLRWNKFGNSETAHSQLQLLELTCLHLLKQLRMISNYSIQFNIRKRTGIIYRPNTCFISFFMQVI